MTTLSRIIGLTLLSLFVLLTSCSSDDDSITIEPTPTGIQTQADLNAYFEEIIETKEIPGFAVSIAIGNDIDYKVSFGFENIAAQRDFSNQTVINIASLSKSFVGAATAKAIEQGYFTLDTPINDLLPVEIVNLENPNAVISIRHLVTHTSGIVDDPSTYIQANYVILPNQNLGTTGANILTDGLELAVMNPVPLAEYLGEYFLEDGALYGNSNFMNSEPGEVWSYSNVATSLMGFVIESATEEDFDSYVNTHILQPLQMNKSTFDVTEVNWQEWAIPYLDKNTPLPFYGNHGYPEGSIHTTNDDLANYLLDMTKGIKGQSNTLFGTAYYELLFTPQLDAGIVPNGFAENHGLYWYKTGNSWSHGGNSLGVSSHMEIKANGSSGFSVIANMDATFSENSPKWEAVLQLIEAGIQEYIQNR
ncbi:serine hydrolase domain-containing protein [Croceitalea rosinachiae]|uniref:Serine hydrolase domain-containing protein n=1 Tax=Croceitalea rosinachiae TaxID=3075596 RepID=A0ABU3AA44_9FLAO|nr:serine hydrolase domain-containing protein [Croceitalea sp. F388]MDT0607061.1 serine hydrolase domain-containing protein [Croceitalea sp. F388]